MSRRRGHGSRPLRMAVVIASLTALLASCGGQWLVYHRDSARTGSDPTAALLPLHRAWNAILDGRVYAEPLIAGSTVFAATENNTVYALRAHDGRIVWKRHLAPPMRNVAAQVGCGNIDPLGITSTPVIDASKGIVFVVETVQDRTGVIHHQLVGLDIGNGAIRVSTNADPGGFQNPLHIQQRASLALGNGRVYIGYGGYAGDCGPYHGWLVSLTERGTGKVVFDATPHTGHGAIWEPGGPAIDRSGHVFVGTGNPQAQPATHDYGESVIKLDATLHVLANFSSSNATDDQDLGATTPALVGGNMVFEIGKQHVGYLLDARTLREIAHVTVCPSSEAMGADAFDGTHLYVPCASGIREVIINAAHRSMSLGWVGPATVNAGPPMVTAGSVWFVDWGAGKLYGLNPRNGSMRRGFPISIGRTPHFAAPATALGLLLIGTNTGVLAFGGPHAA